MARAGRGSGRPSAGWSRCATARRWLVWPTKDVAFTARERLRWEALFADHRAVLLEGAGHHIQDDAPEQIVGAIRDWAAGAGTGLGG